MNDFVHGPLKIFRLIQKYLVYAIDRCLDYDYNEENVCLYRIVTDAEISIHPHM